MSALGDYPAVIHYHYPVSGYYRAEPVRNDKTSPVFHETGQCLVYFCLAVGIDLAHGLVKNQYGRIIQYGPCDNNSLELASAETRAVLAY
jgi:hypothetical protein